MSDSRKNERLSIRVDRETRMALIALARWKGGLNPLELAEELLRDRVKADARAIVPTRPN